MITQLISKTLDLKQLEELHTVKRQLNKVIRKHSRKLVFTKLYLNWEVRYANKTVKLWLRRIITLRLFGDRTKVGELTITLNRLSYLTEILENTGKEYLKMMKKI